MAMDEVQKPSEVPFEKMKQMHQKFIQTFAAGLVPKEGEERDIGKDGLKKLLLKAGEGWEVPRSGDEVVVHYTGMLSNGSKFGNTYQRNEPLQFKLGQGAVIKGFDLGVSTMKKNERAILTIPPELGYGEAGSPPLIPPNATLKFDVELLSWVRLVDVCQDGGIIKRIIADGHKFGWPRDGDEVRVNFVAKLEDGTVVERSPADGVVFYPKQGCFCPAISLAVKTMKTGEQVVLTVKSQYGFGARGLRLSANGGTVPPHATLIIDLELLEWRIMEEITADKGVVKKINNIGDGNLKPNDGSIVKIKYEGKLKDGTVFDKKGHGDEGLFEFKVDEEQVITGLDRAVVSMRKGEIAEVAISPEYGFGNIETKMDLAVVPPNSQLIYEVEMVSFERAKEPFEMSTSDKLEAANIKKEEGNESFKAGKYLRASTRYDKAVRYIEFDSKFTEEEKEKSRQLKIACISNNAACKLKLNSYREAIRLCSRVSISHGRKVYSWYYEGMETKRFALMQILEADPSNIKALYRRAQAYIENTDFDLAAKDVKRMFILDPQNRLCLLQYLNIYIVTQDLRKKGVEHDKKEAKLFGCMMSDIKD